MEVLSLKLKNYIEKFKQYFKDSYGLDNLSKYILIMGMFALLLRYKLLLVLGYCLIGYALWRSISKDKSKRYKEAQIFNRYLFTIKKQFNMYIMRSTNFYKYKVFACPECSQKLRVPRRKGKMVITCKKCNNNFNAKS